jgi:hypothetical protein
VSVARLASPRGAVALALASLVLVLLGAPAALAAPAPAPDPAAGETRSTAEDPVDAQGPLDLSEVSLGQRDVRMVLRIASAGAWDSRGLTSVAGRELCVTLVHGDPALPRARICVTRRSGRTALDLIPLADDGTALAPRALAAEVSRPQPDVLEATFLPAAAGLPLGPYAWFADSAWTDPTTCPATCRDRAPDGDANVDAEVVLLAVAPCFGAAARDPANPCDNPGLHTTVDPPPDRAKVVADPYCDTVQHDGLLTVCSFGPAPEEAQQTFALVGDSHAANMKSAVTVLTLAKRWRGVSILRSGCVTTKAAPILGTPQASRQCQTWNRQVVTWLSKHPEVDTVFLSAHYSARVKPYGGRSDDASAVAGYHDELGTLLRMGRRVVVIRDTPPSTSTALGCVSRALAAGRSAHTTCTRARSASVKTDPLVEAARALHSPKVKVIDLTAQFCDAKRCFTVIGGALVRHDQSHLTQTFAATLGPFVLRALDG